MVNMDSDQHAKHGQYNRDGQVRGVIVLGLGKSCLCMLEEITLWLRDLKNIKISPSISNCDGPCSVYPVEVLYQTIQQLGQESYPLAPLLGKMA